MLKALTTGMCLGLIIAVSPTAIGETEAVHNSVHAAEKSDKPILDVANVSISGIKLGMKESEITKILGKPNSRTVKYDDVCHSAYVTNWKYNGLEIEGLSRANNPSQSRVHKMTVSNSRYSTNKGVKVGDSLGKAEAAYANFQSRFDSEQNLLAFTSFDYGGLVFYSNPQRRIREISILKSSC